MTIFSKVNQTFDRYLINKNIYSIQLSFKQFYQALKYHCKEWIYSYGQHLYLKMSKLRIFSVFKMDFDPC